MTSKDLSQQHLATFDSIKQTDEQGNEYWFARDLAPVLEYRQWRNFLPVIEKAEIACSNSQQQPSDHFAHVRKMVEIGLGAVHKSGAAKFLSFESVVAVIASAVKFPSFGGVPEGRGGL